jgi:Zn-dependent protease
MEDLPYFALKFFVLVVSLTFHEAAHAYAAYRMGDETSSRLGRLSLNPFAHLDPVGTLMFLLPQAPIGWAKPVPVNPMNLRNPGPMMQLISFAGPLSNLALGLLGCLFWFLWFLFGQLFSPGGAAYLMILLFIATNLSLALFNLLPLHPLDGASVITFFMPEGTARKYEDVMHRLGPFPLIVLLVLETLPGMGAIHLWFRFWKPFFEPMLGLFGVPAGVVGYWR